MPELPEVQTVVGELGQRLSGRRFAPGAEALWPRTIGHPGPTAFAERLAGLRVGGVRRRAKYILIELEGTDLLVVHLRMTGNLHFADAGAPAHTHLRARLPLEDGQELRFADMRKFGRLYLGTAEELAGVIPLGTLGPEPLESGLQPRAARLGACRQTWPDQAGAAGPDGGGRAG